MQSMLKGNPSKEIPKEQQLPTRPSVEMIIKAVCETYDVERQNLLNRSHPNAYSAGVYLLRRVVNVHLAEVAELFGISVSRASKIQREVEEGSTDRQMAQLLKKYKVKI